MSPLVFEDCLMSPFCESPDLLDVQDQLGFDPRPQRLVRVERLGARKLPVLRCRSIRDIIGASVENMLPAFAARTFLARLPTTVRLPHEIDTIIRICQRSRRRA